VNDTTYAFNGITHTTLNKTTFNIHINLKNMNTGKVVTAVLASVAVGAALGILFAPEKGSVTRRSISRRSKQFTDDITDKANEFIDNMAERFELAKDEASQLAETGRNKTEQVLSSVAHPKQHN
jgi:gas vesicle protein